MLRRFLERLVREIEGAPVDAEQRAGFEIDKRLHRFFRREMHKFHHFRWSIGAYAECRDIKGTEPLADFLEECEISRISGEIKPPLGTRHRPGRPESLVSVRQRPLGEMLSRHANKF